jgi:hypothetical protein
LQVGNSNPGAYSNVAIYPTVLDAKTVAGRWAFARGMGSGVCPHNPTLTDYDRQVLAGGPVRYYPLNDLDAGRELGDLSGNCIHAAADPRSPALPAPDGGAESGGVLQDPGSAVAFSGSSDGLPTGASPFTVEMWVKDLAYGARPFSFRGVSLESSGTTVNRFRFNSQGQTSLDFYAPWGVRDGGWHHLAVTYDGAVTVSLFLDGIRVGNGTLSSPLATTPADQLQVGNSNPGAYSNVAIYPTVPKQSAIYWRFRSTQGDRPLPGAAGDRPIFDAYDLIYGASGGGTNGTPSSWVGPALASGQCGTYEVGVGVTFPVTGCRLQDARAVGIGVSATTNIGLAGVSVAAGGVVTNTPYLRKWAEINRCVNAGVESVAASFCWSNADPQLRSVFLGGGGSWPSPVTFSFTPEQSAEAGLFPLTPSGNGTVFCLTEPPEDDPLQDPCGPPV